MGITTSKKATNIQFDVTVPDKHFKLPDYPVKKTTSFFSNEDFDNEEWDMEDIDENMDKLSKLSFEESKKMTLADKEDEEMQNMSEQELREMYDMIQKMVKIRLFLLFEKKAPYNLGCLLLFFFSIILI